LVPGADSAIALLRERGTKILFVTNNATKSPAEYVKRLRGMGISVTEKDVFTSAMATAEYLAGKHCRGEKVYVLGGDALKEELSKVGCAILGEEKAKEADMMVSALDLGLTYNRLKAACYAIQAGAKYIVTNLDANLPMEVGYEPGSGAIAAAVTAATSTKPLLIGKPSKIMVGLALKRLGVKRDSAIMVGDRLDSDIKAAKSAGLRSVLVLTGVTRNLRGVRKELLPDVTIPSVADLPELLLERRS